MSQEVVDRLARRWNCSTKDVGRVIYKRLAQAGLIKDEPADLKVGDDARATYAKTGASHYFTLGVADDDRIAVLDEDDQPVLWL